MRVSVVVPVFNAAPSLAELCDGVRAALGSDAAVSSWELLLVNDGSQDESWERIVELSREHPEVRGLDLTRNWGQHNALLAGIHVASGEVIVTIDDDLQNPPEEIPRLLEALGEDVDLVYGTPIAKRQALPRRLATRVVRRTLEIVTAGGLPAYITGFRAFRASLLDGVDGAQGRNVTLDALLTASAAGVAAVPVEHERRRHGRSNYSLRRLIGHTVAEVRSLRKPGASGGRSRSYAVRATTGAGP